MDISCIILFIIVLYLLCLCMHRCIPKQIRVFGKNPYFDSDKHQQAHNCQIPSCRHIETETKMTDMINVFCPWHRSLRGASREELLTSNKQILSSNGLFLCFLCFTLPFTVSSVKCQTVCDSPTGAIDAIQPVLQTFAHKLWAGRETSDNMHLLEEPLSAVIWGHTDSCHTNQLCHTCKTMPEMQI